MPLLQARTRAQVRRHVGFNLQAVREGVMTGAGDATSVIDTSLPGDADDHNGKWIIFTSGTNDGRIRRVSDDNGAGDLTIAATNTPLANTAQGDTYELWNQDFNPTNIHNLINMALLAATPRVFDPRDDISLYADNKTRRFDIPSDFMIINSIQYRKSVPTEIIHQCERLFDETTDANFTQSLDDDVVKEGTNSLKIVVAAGAAAGDVITDSFTAVDISEMTHLEGWIRCSVTAAAADLIIHLNDTAVLADSNDQESLNMPALVADTWTYFHVALTNWSNLTAIASVGLEYNTDLGASTIWLDDLKAVQHDEANWEDLHRHHWSIDGESRDLILRDSGRGIAGYHMLKLRGGNVPSFVSTAESSAGEGTTFEVPEEFVVTRATGLALSSAAEAGGPRADGRNRLAGFWIRESNRALRAFPLITNGRAVPTA